MAPRRPSSPPPRRQGERWTKHELLYLLCERRTGISHKIIGRQIGKSHLACRLQLHHATAPKRSEAKAKKLKYCQETAVRELADALEQEMAMSAAQALVDADSAEETDDDAMSLDDDGVEQESSDKDDGRQPLPSKIAAASSKTLNCSANNAPFTKGKGRLPILKLRMRSSPINLPKYGEAGPSRPRRSANARRLSSPPMEGLELCDDQPTMGRAANPVLDTIPMYQPPAILSACVKQASSTQVVDRHAETARTLELLYSGATRHDDPRHDSAVLVDEEGLSARQREKLPDRANEHYTRSAARRESAVHASRDGPSTHRREMPIHRVNANSPRESARQAPTVHANDYRVSTRRRGVSTTDRANVYNTRSSERHNSTSHAPIAAVATRRQEMIVDQTNEYNGRSSVRHDTMVRDSADRRSARRREILADRIYEYNTRSSARRARPQTPEGLDDHTEVSRDDSTQTPIARRSMSDALAAARWRSGHVGSALDQQRTFSPPLYSPTTRPTYEVVVDRTRVPTPAPWTVRDIGRFTPDRVARAGSPLTDSRHESYEPPSRARSDYVWAGNRVERLSFRSYEPQLPAHVEVHDEPRYEGGYVFSGHRPTQEPRPREPESTGVRLPSLMDLDICPLSVRARRGRENHRPRL